MLVIIKIIIYPVKGLKGIEVDEAIASERGFHYDRRWMLVDKNGVFISQRTHPEMARIGQFINGESLKLTWEDNSVTTPLRPNNHRKCAVKVLDHVFEVSEVKGEVNDFVSDILHDSLHMVYMDEVDQRIKQLRNTIPRQVHLSFADGYPYLILGSASMEELNDRLEEKISYNRFRPNIYIRTSEPHEEDNWDTFSTACAQFKVIKPCVRCKVTTIDQTTAQQGKEPLQTLATYRKDSGGVIFGSNVINLKPGLVKVGDIINHL